VCRGEIRPEMVEARERGIIFDIGHGMGGFGFASTRPMLEAGFLPDVISSDVHILCEHGPAFDLLHSMSKLWCLGVPLVEVIRAASARPAEALRRPDLGTLKPGSAGDAVLLEVREGRFDYVDVMGERITGERRLEVRRIVLGGRLWHEVEET
jgi:dihydroorotase